MRTLRLWKKNLMRIERHLQAVLTWLIPYFDDMQQIGRSWERPLGDFTRINIQVDAIEVDVVHCLNICSELLALRILACLEEWNQEQGNAGPRESRAVKQHSLQVRVSHADSIWTSCLLYAKQLGLWYNGLKGTTMWLSSIPVCLYWPEVYIDRLAFCL